MPYIDQEDLDLLETAVKLSGQLNKMAVAKIEELHEALATERKKTKEMDAIQARLRSLESDTTCEPCNSALGTHAISCTGSKSDWVRKQRAFIEEENSKLRAHNSRLLSAVNSTLDECFCDDGDGGVLLPLCQRCKRLEKVLK